VSLTQVSLSSHNTLHAHFLCSANATTSLSTMSTELRTTQEETSANEDDVILVPRKKSRTKSSLLRTTGQTEEGHLAANPYVNLFSPEVTRKQYVAGVFDGDGHVQCNSKSVSLSLAQAVPISLEMHAMVTPPMFDVLVSVLGKPSSIRKRKGPWRDVEGALSRDWIRNFRVKQEDPAGRDGARDQVSYWWEGETARIGLEVLRDHAVLKHEQAMDSLECLDAIQSHKPVEIREALSARVKATHGAKLASVDFHTDRMNMNWVGGMFDAEGGVNFRPWSTAPFQIQITQLNHRLLQAFKQKLFPTACVQERYFSVSDAITIRTFAEYCFTNKVIHHKQAQLYLMQNVIDNLRPKCNSNQVTEHERAFFDDIQYEMKRMKHDRCWDAREAIQRLQRGDFDNFYTLGRLSDSCIRLGTEKIARSYDAKDSTTHPVAKLGNHSRWMLFNAPSKPIKRSVFGHEMYRTLCVHCKKSYPVDKTTGGNKGLRCHQSKRKSSSGCCARHGCSFEMIEGITMCKTTMEMLQTQVPTVSKSKLDEFMSKHF
jgi:hypothetical protein